MLAVARPLPGTRNDCTAYAARVNPATEAATVIADGGYRDTGLLAHRGQLGQAALPTWQEEHPASHRRVRAQAKHILASLKDLR